MSMTTKASWDCNLSNSSWRSCLHTPSNLQATPYSACTIRSFRPGSNIDLLPNHQLIKRTRFDSPRCIMTRGPRSQSSITQSSLIPSSSHLLMPSRTPHRPWQARRINTHRMLGNWSPTRSGKRQHVAPRHVEYCERS